MNPVGAKVSQIVLRRVFCNVSRKGRPCLPLSWLELRANPRREWRPPSWGGIEPKDMGGHHNASPEVRSLVVITINVGMRRRGQGGV